MADQKNTRGTVLLVDDEPDVREIIAMGIADPSIDVLEAGNGQEALDILKVHRVDAIISDLMMPRVSGLRLLTQLREQGATQPFIVITGYSSQETTLQALRLGAFDYIEKPFDSDDLHRILGEAIRVGKALNQSLARPSPSEQGTAEIHRLRTLRYSESSPSGNDGANSNVQELLIAEATPQLLFCEAAIRGLADPETRVIELGYLFRVMQALATAAASADADALRQVAGAAALFYSTLRVRPRAVDETTVDLASRINAILLSLLAGQGQAPQKATSDLIRELSRATAELESGLSRAG